MTTSRAVRVVCTVLGVLVLGAAAIVALTPLPVPAAGGTCGPSTSSESALLAFANPVSIGAGPKPSAASGQRSQWDAFVGQCQSAADARMAVAGGIVAGALVVMFGLPWVVKRFDVDEDEDGSAPAAFPGWYPDPAEPSAARWWDGQAWGPQAVPTPGGSPWTPATPVHG